MNSLNYLLSITLILIIICKLNAQLVNDMLDKYAWDNFKRKYTKKYSDIEDERTKMNIWKSNKVLVYEHNKRADKGLETYRLAENSFMDTNPNDRDWKRLGYNPFSYFADFLNRKWKKRSITTSFSIMFYQRPRNLVLPASYDARNVIINGTKVSLATPVKDQGECGSCWAFSALDALTTQYFLKYGKLIELSVQELVDCSDIWSNNACIGGAMDNVYRYAWDLGGVFKADAYPYNGNNGTCVPNCSDPTRYAATVGYVRIQVNEINLQSALISRGTISVGINAALPTFRLYSEGIYSDISCDPRDLNHAMTLVGYGVDRINGTSVPYWLLKNSWGVDWGMKGYMKILRNGNNICGVMSSATYPVLF